MLSLRQCEEKSFFIKRLFFFTLLAILILPLTGAGKAIDSRKLEKQKSDLEQRRQVIKSELNKKRLKQKDLSKIFRQVDEELTRTTHELSRKNQDLSYTRLQEQYYKKQLQKAENNFAAYRNKYKDRLVAYYKNGHAGYIEVLFNSTSFSDFVGRLTYLRILTKNDLGIMDKMKQMQQEIADKKEKVESARIQIELDAQLLNQEKQHVAVVYKEKQKALNDIQKDVALLEKQDAELERESRRIEQDLARSRGPGPQYKFDGRFDSPVCGRSFIVRSPFGWRSPPCRGCSSHHQGIDLQSARGAPICAAAKGRVFSAGYIGGYGYTVIIQHDSTYATLYAHASAILVSKGQEVQKGQVVIRTGSSGNVTGPHLHFEIRMNGVPVNPLGYFR